MFEFVKIKMDQIKNWEKISSKYAFRNEWVKVRQDKVKLPNGKIIDNFFVFEENNVALIVPVTKEGKFVFVKQYKHALGAVTTEFPAGYLNFNEDPMEAAKRELKEETGFKAGKIEALKLVVNSPTKIQSNINIFLAVDCEQVFDQKKNQDDQEDIEIVLADTEQVLNMISKDEIIVTGTISAFFLTVKKLNLE